VNPIICDLITLRQTVKNKYYPKSISLEKLDMIADIIIKPTTGKWESFLAGAKLLMVFVYLIARKNILDQEREAAKQEHEIQTGNEDRSELDRENLDGL
jgi:hypothetical protein